MLIIPKLESRGFSVFFNGPNNDGIPVIVNERNLSLEMGLSDLYLVCKSGNVACFVSIRSGVCDFLAACGCPIFCVCPDTAYGQELLKKQSLVDWGGKAPIKEVIYSKTTADECLAFIDQTNR